MEVCSFKAVSGFLSSWLAMLIKVSLRCPSSLRAELSSAKTIPEAGTKAVPGIFCRFAQGKNGLFLKKGVVV